MFRPGRTDLGAPNYARSMEARLVRLGRDHPGWVDAAVLTVALIASLASSFYVAEFVGPLGAVLLNGVPPLFLAARCRAPELVLAAVLGFALVQWAVAVPFNLVQLSLLIALYTVARERPGRTARTAAAATLVLALIAPLRQPFAGFSGTVFAALAVLLVHLIGANVGLRQAYLSSLEERADRLEREREAAAEVAAARERARIARELHDVVAHHVSVMVVQAEGAGWALDDRPEQARTAVETIARTGRGALTELRRLLGVLRADDPDDRRPQPGLADLPALIDSFRAGGLQVEDQTGPAASTGVDPIDPVELADSLQLAVFRIVQEGLTNVLKHAGPAAAVRIEVDCRCGPAGSGELRLEIVDDGGRGGGTGAVTGPVAPGGHGLVGIRERVALFGGQVRIGPGPDGGFAVRARLPAGGGPR